MQSCPLNGAFALDWRFSEYVSTKTGRLGSKVGVDGRLAYSAARRQYEVRLST